VILVSSEHAFPFGLTSKQIGSRHNDFTALHYGTRLMKKRVWDLWIVPFGSESDAFVRQLVILGQPAVFRWACVWLYALFV
jgi:hypothetical protein